MTGVVSPRGLGSYDEIEIELPVGWMLATCIDKQALADDLLLPDWVMALPPDDEGTWRLTMGQAIRHGLLSDPGPEPLVQRGIDMMANLILIIALLAVALWSLR